MDTEWSRKPVEQDTTDDPGPFETQRARCERLLQEGDWAKARPCIERMLELRPTYAPAHNQLGVCYFNEEDFEQAAKCFKRSIQLDFDLVEAHFNLACLYQYRGRYQEALSHFKEVVTANPEDVGTYNRMGACCLALDEGEDAEAFFAEALRLRPDFLDPLVSLTMLYMKQGTLSDAEAILREGLEYHPEATHLRFTLGLVLKSQEKSEEALGVFREVVLADGENAEAFNHLGECCMALGMEEQAECFFAQAAKLDPGMCSAVFNLGQLYHDRKQWDKAIMMFEEWLRQEDSEMDLLEALSEEKGVRAAVYQLLGTCYAEQGDHDRARELWDHALEMDPGQTERAAKLGKLARPLDRQVTLTIDD